MAMLARIRAGNRGHVRRPAPPGLEDEVADGELVEHDEDEDRGAAARAELAVTSLGPLEHAELVDALHDLDVRRGPERRGVDRRAQPAAARAAVAVGLDIGLARQLDLDRAAEATAPDYLSHWGPPLDSALTMPAPGSEGRTSGGGRAKLDGTSGWGRAFLAELRHVAVIVM